ncbi:hypothetical protein HJC06_10610 [Rhizobium sp. NLR9b]|uniref:hypothetical protein n=1 Tax=unclassified Rhizobium TaxID=2613769 RepID=UPI001C82D5AC|nr:MULTISPECIES: hypothetical protein [unclassified Rhizobium]MBX5217877.1 hypothetical protein [Rhizobium sp. NLR9a]MBX5226876.1 hypothetical protein [Rhizobium sp. NLR9b]MBX5287547.1 hypothetical protein [Rhizobium sp. NLR10b]
MADTNTGIYASFSLEPVEQTFLTEKEGRPIFADKEFVRIFIAGDKHTEVYREVTENDKLRFSDAYRRFKDGAAAREQLVGTPLSQWPYLKPSQIKELEAINIYTVEQMAALSDTAKQKLGMGANELVAAARGYLATAENSSAASAFAAENERLKGEVERLNDQMKQMASRFEALENERQGGGKGRGREAA